MYSGPRRRVCGEGGGPGGRLPCWGKGELAWPLCPSYPHPQEQAGPQVRKAGTLMSSGGVPVAAGLSRGSPAPRPPGVTWGPGSAAAGVGEGAGGGPGGQERGDPLMTHHHSSPCPERLRQVDACGQKSDELVPGNDASLHSVLPKNACIYHEGPSGGGVRQFAVAGIGAWIRGGELVQPHGTEEGERRPQGHRISQVPPVHP